MFLHIFHKNLVGYVGMDEREGLVHLNIPGGNDIGRFTGNELQGMQHNVFPFIGRVLHHPDGHGRSLIAALFDVHFYRGDGRV